MRSSEEERPAPSRRQGRETALEGARPLRVASVPAGHVYVSHIAPEEDLAGVRRVERLHDPDPEAPEHPAQARWWPPAMLDPAWVRSHRDFDLLHLQFGFDARPPEQLAEWAEALRETGRPFVYTVHDLRNPHHRDRTLHDEQLEVLIPRADALITLTRGAADEIRDRWGREARVLPHPHVVDVETMRRAAARPPSSGPFRVGVHLKSLRASMNPLPVLRALEEAVGRLPGVVLQVNGHRDVLTEEGAHYDPELTGYLRRGAEEGSLELHVHDFLEDEQFVELPLLAGRLRAPVPLRHPFGLAGGVPRPRDGGDRPQLRLLPAAGAGLRVRPRGGSASTPGLWSGRSAAPTPAGAPRPVPVETRRAQRRAVAEAHAELYERLLR
jgi:hypothetical protein